MLVADLSFLLLLLSLLTPLSVRSAPPPPYLSPAIFAADYDDMLRNFRIFVYDAHRTFKFKSEAESLFLASLLSSRFVTDNPSEAHLFFVPFDGDLSERSAARVVRDLRADLPYWNRTLGADHFYASCDGIGFGSSDRNLLELKKNSVQMSCFPASDGRFVPHKDVALPPARFGPAGEGEPRAPPSSRPAEHLAYGRLGAIRDPGLANRLAGDRDFLMEAGPSDRETFERRLATSEFCLFDYGGDVSWIGDAMRLGCVPVVITDRPIQDLPLIDVLRWQEMAAFVGSGGAAEGVKRAVREMTRERVERMRGSCVAASRHLAWNRPPEPLDAFHMVVYQLWLRRHTIRYARRE